MSKKIIPDEIVMSKIYVFRGQKVMLDRDLAELYGVETKYLKRQVKRNISRFPEDFMFELNKDEFEDWRSQFVTSKSDKKGLRYAPYAFTEQGVAMLSGVLNSERAINMNIQIMRIFTKMRQLVMSHKEILKRLDKIESTIEGQGHEIQVLFEYIKRLMQEQETVKVQSSRKKIGFKKN